MQNSNCLTPFKASTAKASSRFCPQLILFAALALIYHSTTLAAPFAYIGEPSVLSVFDTATDTTSVSIDIKDDTTGSPASVDRIVVNPAGTTVYIMDKPHHKVRVFDAASKTVTAHIKLKTAETECTPEEIAINPAGTQVLVTGRDGQKQDHDCTTVIDTATNQIKIFAIDSGSSVLGRKVTYINNHTVYITDAGDHEVIRVFDTSTNTLKASIPAVFPTIMVTNPAGTRVYVNDRIGSFISVIDTATHTKIAEIDQAVDGMAVNSAGTRLYVSHWKGIAVIDTATNTPIAKMRWRLGTVLSDSYIAANNIAINHDGTRVYALADDLVIHIIDTAINNVIRIAKVDGSLLAMAPIPALVTSPIANCLFNWAEAHYPKIFSPARPETQQAAGYNYRYYSGTNTYLGVYQSSNIHILQPKVSPNIIDVGTIAQFKPITGCQ